MDNAIVGDAYKVKYSVFGGQSYIEIIQVWGRNIVQVASIATEHAIADAKSFGHPVWIESIESIGNGFTYPKSEKNGAVLE